jgi:hypothetical protein
MLFVDITPYGEGLFTADPIPVGRVVLSLDGRFTSIINADADCYALSDTLYLDPGDHLGRWVNHSCDPNCWVRIRGVSAEIVAWRDIEPKEEITYDYAQNRPGDEGVWSFPCFCEAENCRMVISGWDSLSPDRQAWYRQQQVVPEYLRKRL